MPNPYDASVRRPGLAATRAVGRSEFNETNRRIVELERRIDAAERELQLLKLLKTPR